MPHCTDVQDPMSHMKLFHDKNRLCVYDCEDAKIVSLLSTFRWILLFNLLSIFYPGSCTLLKRFAKNEN